MFNNPLILNGCCGRLPGFEIIVTVLNLSAWVYSSVSGYGRSCEFYIPERMKADITDIMLCRVDVFLSDIQTAFCILLFKVSVSCDFSGRLI